MIKLNNENIYTVIQEWQEDHKRAEEKYGHISDWDVSNVTTMARLFADAESFNQNIGKWDVSNVTNMNFMFAGAKSFNQDIGSWDVSNVTEMQSMFYAAELFNQDIGSWDLSNVRKMNFMFYKAESFNGDIGSWDVSNVSAMSKMFEGAKSFNQDIGSWDVSNVSYMHSMFEGAKSFNQDISGWDVSNIKGMESMFKGAESFNQDISRWGAADKLSKDEHEKIYNVIAEERIYYEVNNPGNTFIGFWIDIHIKDEGLHIDGVDYYGNYPVIESKDENDNYNYYLVKDIPFKVETENNVSFHHCDDFETEEGAKIYLDNIKEMKYKDALKRGLIPAPFNT